jgi:rod shape-determining protein MreD
VTRPASLSGQKALLLGLGAAGIYAALIPLAPGTGLVPPDIVFCLVIAWTVRSPRAVPLWLILVLGLAGDVMLSRPIGLGALGLVLACEAMRVRAARLRAAPFPVEWAAATAAFAVVLAGQGLVLALSLVPGPGVAAGAACLLATALAYPVVAGALAWGLGLRGQRPAGPLPRRLA